MYDTFSQFGKILSSKIATGPGGESKGHGFVQYEDEASAQAAIDTVNGKELVGQQVFVGPFKRREDRDTGVDKFTNLYVKNLDESVTDDTLQKVFGEIGTLSSAIVMKDEEGKSKGFGFVNYENSEDAHAAVEKLNGHKHEETEWEVTKAQKKAEREAELKAKFEKVCQRSCSPNQVMSCSTHLVLIVHLVYCASVLTEPQAALLLAMLLPEIPCFCSCYACNLQGLHSRSDAQTPMCSVSCFSLPSCLTHAVHVVLSLL